LKLIRKDMWEILEKSMQLFILSTYNFIQRNPKFFNVKVFAIFFIHIWLM